MLPTWTRTWNASSDVSAPESPVHPSPSPRFTQEDAYRVQYRLIDRLKDGGEVVVGHKVALTTEASRAHLGVDEPCYGHILDRGVYANDSEVPIGNLANPHIEAETAFVMGEDLKGPGVTPVQVMKAAHAVVPALELVDLKVTGDGIDAIDVIAHNAFHGGVVVGSRMVRLEELDLQYEGVTVEFNGSLHGSGTGFEVMGTPSIPSSGWSTSWPNSTTTSRLANSSSPVPW